MARIFVIKRDIDTDETALETKFLTTSEDVYAKLRL